VALASLISRSPSCSHLPCFVIVPQEAATDTELLPGHSRAAQGRWAESFRGSLWPSRGGVSGAGEGGEWLQTAGLTERTAEGVETGETQQALGPALDERLDGGSDSLAEELSAPRKEPAAIALGEQAEVADADEAIGQDVEQETAVEFVGVEPQDFPTLLSSAVLVAEEHVVALEADGPLIRDRHPVGVTAEVA
jgi:hypothetical protein